MIVDARLSCSAAKTTRFISFILFSKLVFLWQAEVDDMQNVPLLAKPYKEIVRLDVAVEEALKTDVLDSGYGLIGD